MPKSEIPKLGTGKKEFVLGINEDGENKFTDKLRLDAETIIVLEGIEDNATIARFTIINNLWTEVASLQVEQETSLGHVTVMIAAIEKNCVKFLLK
jgi:GTPase